MNMDLPLLIPPVLLSNTGWLNIGQPVTVSFAHNSRKIALAPLSLPLLHVSA